MRELSLAEIFRVTKACDCDTFDNIEVACWWLADHHAGQGSQSFTSLCRLQQTYSPGLMQNRPHNWEAYRAVCDAAGCTHDPCEE